MKRYKNNFRGVILMLSNSINTMKMYNGFGIKVGTIEFDNETEQYIVTYEIPDYDYYEGKFEDENF